MVKTIELSGTVETVSFSASYTYYWVDNKGESTVYASVGEPVADSDGTYTIEAGTQLRVPGSMSGGIKLLGTGKVQVIATDSAFSPFNESPKGGEISRVEEKVDTLAETVEKLHSTDGVPVEASGAIIHITDASTNGVQSLTVYGKSVQNGTPTPDVPVDIVSIGGGGNVEITVCGKNILKYPFGATTKTENGITFTDSGDGRITVNGTATATARFHLVSYGVPFNVAESCMLSGCPSGGSVSTYAIQAYGSGNKYDVGNGVAIPAGEWEFRINIYAGTVCDNLVFKLMLEVGETVTGYEPYTGETATITTGLPLCSVGDICDEMTCNADGTGKVIKRTEIITSYNGETISGAYISATGELSTGAKIVYVQDEPTEIPLTAEEMQSVLALRTYKPITNCYNSENAHQTVGYLADTKMYIDKKFDELAVAIVASRSE